MISFFFFFLKFALDLVGQWNVRIHGRKRKCFSQGFWCGLWDVSPWALALSQEIAQHQKFGPAAGASSGEFGGAPQTLLTNTGLVCSKGWGCSAVPLTTPTSQSKRFLSRTKKPRCSCFCLSNRRATQDSLACNKSFQHLPFLHWQFYLGMQSCGQAV